MSKQDEWVRVESEDELREGMTVKVLECEWCNRDDVMVISKIRPASGFAVAADLGVLSSWSKYSVSTLGSCDDTARWQLGTDINAGMLFRLDVPPDEAALADEKEASRRAAKVKERTR